MLGGFLAGFVGVIFGVGGGIVLIPTLLYTGTKTKKTVGTSLAVMVFISLSGTIQHVMKGTFQPTQDNLMLLLAGVVGALIGAMFLESAKSKTITYLIIAYFILMGTNLIINPTFVEIKFIYELPKEAFWLSGIVVAIISTILGVGGGAIMTPLMLYVFNMPAKQVLGLVMPFIFFMSFTATSVNMKNKFIDLKAFAFLTPSALAGTYVAYLFFNRITDIYLQMGIGALLILNAIAIMSKYIFAKRS